MTDNKHNDGGPAFPQPISELCGEFIFPAAYGLGGMSLRDYFAAQAIAGLTVGLVGRLTVCGRSEISAYAHGECNAVLAERAYALADAMLKERSKKL